MANLTPPGGKTRGGKTKARLKPNLSRKAVLERATQEALRPRAPALAAAPVVAHEAWEGFERAAPAAVVPAPEFIPDNSYAFDPLAQPGVPEHLLHASGVLNWDALLAQWRAGRVLPETQVDLIESLVLGQSPLSLEDEMHLERARALAVETRPVLDVQTQAQAEQYLAHASVQALQARGLLAPDQRLAYWREWVAERGSAAPEMLTATPPEHLAPRPSAGEAHLPALDAWRARRQTQGEQDPAPRQASTLG